MDKYMNGGQEVAIRQKSRNKSITKFTQRYKGKSEKPYFNVQHRTKQKKVTVQEIGQWK